MKPATKRARAAQLALVNWRGVFYERYELSHTVTALEGANGAGKTTVLIAAFVALLPDMNHLRFAAAGSSGDRGIWGRLGEAGRPAYAVLDFTLANGERFLAGVRLERRAEPVVELTSFFITDFPHGARLQNLLLLRGTDKDAVPEIEELRVQAGRHGANFHVCATAKEYFSALFERGVSPLRLEREGERRKVAEMLRTSMTGGMSQVLTTGLRAFLLKEEGGLAATLKRMRSNIDACRRTRGEVDDARRLETEISDVFEAGQNMFRAAAQATEQAASEAAGGIAEAEEALGRAEHDVTAAATELDGVVKEAEVLGERLKTLASALKQAEDHYQRLESGRAQQEVQERVGMEVAALCRTHGWDGDVHAEGYVDDRRQALFAQRDEARDEAARLEETRKKTEAGLRSLREAGGSLPAVLRAIATRLGAPTAAEKFEDIGIAEAGARQARLGPLVEAVLVDDLEAAARTVADIKDRPDTVWLARPEALDGGLAGEASQSSPAGDSVIVRSSPDVMRVSRVPDRPVLGRRARETLIRDLEEELARTGADIRAVRDRSRGIDRALGAIDNLQRKLADIAVARTTLAGLGIEDAGEAALASGREHLDKCQRSHGEADRLSRELHGRRAVLQYRLDQQRQARTRARQALNERRAAAEPAHQRWKRLRADAEADGLLAGLSGPDGRTASAALYGDARTYAGRLHERLARAEPGCEAANVVNGLFRLEEGARPGEAYLHAWREVRVWMQRRIPAQIAQMDDPLEALTRLRSQLGALQERLVRQETELQGKTTDVANAIGVHIRRADREIAKLNTDLDGVRFGSIAGVRLRLGRVSEMTNILDALRDRDDQGGLFAADRPLEEALNDLLRKYAGGRAQGERLLDYREYVDPRVEVWRNSGTGWEAANPTHLSTGESIGIGAALMMVVLTAWEHDARLFKARSADSTLRLLLLDEANRLDRDNLGMLFDLCASLDLQLLVAAPEVGRAEGNTTYHLVRVADGEGGEEVRVTGRRAIRAEAEAA